MPLNSFVSKNNQSLRTVLILFIILDFILSWFQYINMPLGGDLYAVVLPAPWYSEVLNDPFGLKVWLEEASYSGAGRYFAHWTMESWFKTVPFIFQKFVSSISSIYYSVALFKLLMHGGIAFILGGYICGHFRMRSTEYLMSAAMVLPFIQTYELYVKIGLLDHSITYVFFYIYPVLILMLLLFPAYRYYLSGKWPVKKLLWIPWIVGAVYAAQFGPLVQSVMILSGVLVLFSLWASSIWYRGIAGWSKPLRNPSRKVVFAVVLLILFGFYGYLTGMANTENKEALPIVEVFARAWDGMVFHYISAWHFYY